MAAKQNNSLIGRAHGRDISCDTMAAILENISNMADKTNSPAKRYLHIYKYIKNNV